MSILAASIAMVAVPLVAGGVYGLSVFIRTKATWQCRDCAILLDASSSIDEQGYCQQVHKSHGCGESYILLLCYIIPPVFLFQFVVTDRDISLSLFVFLEMVVQCWVCLLDESHMPNIFHHGSPTLKHLVFTCWNEQYDVSIHNISFLYIHYSSAIIFDQCCYICIS